MLLGVETSGGDQGQDRRAGGAHREDTEDEGMAARSYFYHLSSIFSVAISLFLFLYIYILFTNPTMVDPRIISFIATSPGIIGLGTIGPCNY